MKKRKENEKKKREKKNTQKNKKGKGRAKMTKTDNFRMYTFAWRILTRRRMWVFLDSKVPFLDVIILKGIRRATGRLLLFPRRGPTFFRMWTAPQGKRGATWGTSILSNRENYLKNCSEDRRGEKERRREGDRKKRGKTHSERERKIVSRRVCNKRERKYDAHVSCHSTQIVNSIQFN